MIFVVRAYFFHNPVSCAVFPLRMTTSKAGLLPSLSTKVSLTVVCDSMFISTPDYVRATVE